MPINPDFTTIPDTDIDADSPITVALMTALRNNILNAALVGCSEEFCGPASEIPVGWLECDGAAVSRTTYADLFATIGTIWGIGDGSTTFNLPNDRGRSSIGAGTGAGLTARTLGAIGGEETHSMILAENGPHAHNQRGLYNFVPSVISSSGNSAPRGVISDAYFNTHIQSSGSGTGHNTMHPFNVKIKIIKVIK